MNLASQLMSALIPAASAIALMGSSLGNYFIRNDENITREIGDDLRGFLNEHLGENHIVGSSDYSSSVTSLGDVVPCLSHSRISVSRKLWSVDREALGYLIKHEISHIREHDVTSSLLFTFGASLPGMILSFVYPNLETIWVSTQCISIFASLWFRIHKERHAVEFSIKHSTIEELKAGLCYELALRDIAIQKRDSRRVWRIFTTANGNDRFAPGVCQLSFSERIVKIIKELKHRSITIETTRVDLLNDLRPSEENEPLIHGDIEMGGVPEIYHLENQDVLSRINRIKEVIVNPEMPIANPIPDPAPAPVQVAVIPQILHQQWRYMNVPMRPISITATAA